MTLTELAQKAEVPQSTLSEICAGKYPCGVRTAKRLSRVTGRDWTDYLKMSGPEIEADLRRALARESQATPEAPASAVA